MFRGNYEHSIDEKGRLAIPSKFREQLSAHAADQPTFIVTIFKDCLAAYSQEEWKVLETKLSRLNQFDRKVQAFQRYFVAYAKECPIDKGGRILLPQTLTKFVNIEKEVVIVGQLNKLEIWAKEKWSNLIGELTGEFEDFSQHLGELGLNL